jgi:putative transposase
MSDREHPLSVVRQPRVLEISRGAVYFKPRPTGESDLALMRGIDQPHLEHPFMGARRLRIQMQRQGIHVGWRHMGTLMQRMGIQALCPLPSTSKRDPHHKVDPYLLRKVTIRRATQVWALATT